MGEDGLAAAYAGQEMGQAPQTGGISVQEIVMMLKQGVTPEELAQNGVPVQLIEEALMMLQAEVEQGGPMQGAPDQQGLAGMYMDSPIHV